MAASREEIAQGMKIATQEMEYKVELFNKMVSSCFEKCMDKRYKEADLNVGENSCVDRCASKYWQNAIACAYSGKTAMFGCLIPVLQTAQQDVGGAATHLLT